VVGGVAAATLLVLFVVPILYLLLKTDKHTSIQKETAHDD
jgi:Cu/Ag efflux pump CusA